MKNSINSKFETNEYNELLDLAIAIITHIEFRTYLYNNNNLKNTDEYQELRKYLRGMPK